MCYNLLRQIFVVPTITVVYMEVRFEVKVTRGFSLSPRRFRDSLSPLRRLLLISFAKKNQEKPLGPGYENVAYKVNLLSYNLCRGYSNSFTLSNASELFLRRTPKSHIQVQEEKKSSCLLLMSSIKREIRHFPIRSRAVTVKKCTKKRDGRAGSVQGCCFSPSNQCFFDVLVVVAVVVS